MSLPSPWIDELFDRLSVRYGKKMADAYEGQAIDDVKADWANVLDQTSAHAIKYALVNLPITWPPTATEFLELCRRAPADPARAQAALPAPPVDPKVKAEAIAKLKTFKFGQGDPRGWISRLVERRDAGEILNLTHRTMLAQGCDNLGLDVRGVPLAAVPGSAVAASDAARTARLKAESEKRVSDAYGAGADLPGGWSKERRDAHQAMLDRAEFGALATPGERSDSLRRSGDIPQVP
jgi:hypothetical protein